MIYEKKKLINIKDLEIQLKEKIDSDLKLKKLLKNNSNNQKSIDKFLER